MEAYNKFPDSFGHLDWELLLSIASSWMSLWDWEGQALPESTVFSIVSGGVLARPS